MRNDMTIHELRRQMKENNKEQTDHFNDKFENLLLSIGASITEQQEKDNQLNEELSQNSDSQASESAVNDVSDK